MLLRAHPTWLADSTFNNRECKTIKQRLPYGIKLFESTSPLLSLHCSELWLVFKNDLFLKASSERNCAGAIMHAKTEKLNDLREITALHIV